MDIPDGVMFITSMQTKSDKIRDALASGDTKKALSIASKFFDRGGRKGF